MTTEAAETVLYHDTCHHLTYHLTCEEFDALHTYAEGCCQICRTPERETKRGRLSIDHLGDYGLQAVRGLLCDLCNCLMEFVDRNKLRTYSREYDDSAVRLYRYNAWFARQAHPKGPNIRFRDRGIDRRRPMTAQDVRALLVYVEDEK